MSCKRCGSWAINHGHHGRDGSDPELCDVCYWRKRTEAKDAELAGYVEANRYMKGELDDAIDDARKYAEANREIARLREALESASSFAVGRDIRVDKCWQRDGSFLWAVRKFGNVLANDGAGWNYETIPSERDEAFMERYRFATMELAMTAARAALAQVAEVGNG